MIVVGACPVCGQGRLEVWKYEGSGELFVICDECMLEFASPRDAKALRNGRRVNGVRPVVPAGINDIPVDWRNWKNKSV